MSITAAPGEKYTLRCKFFRVFGNAFHIYLADGTLAAYCKQRAFKLKEDLRVYTDESQTEELFRIGARSIIDLGATYDVRLPTGETIGSLRRKGLKSAFVRDEWLVSDEQGQQVATLREQGTFPMLRRIDYVGTVMNIVAPQRYEIQRPDGTPIARFRQHFNPVIYRLGISVLADDEVLDELVILAAACLVGSIEGRQQ